MWSSFGARASDPGCPSLSVAAVRVLETACSYCVVVARPEPRLLALALLVARVALADHHDASVTTDHLAVIADLLDAGVDLHVLPSIRCPREELLTP